MNAKTLWVVFFLSLAACLCDAGSLCPEREMIYPCHCTSIPINKKTSFTIVSCRHVPHSDSLARIIVILRMMQIDRFILYDSFWEVNKLDSSLNVQRRLPDDWLSQLHIQQFEIIDTHLSNDFACGIKSSCPNRAVKHFSIRNSSTSDSIQAQCKTDSTSVIFWTSCLNMLETFFFTHSKLKKFDRSVFPNVMQSLRILNLSHNEIESVGDYSFTNLVKLHSLDLSFNKIASLPSRMLGNNNTVLEFLDLSDNRLYSLPADVFKYAPFLVTFVVQNNEFARLPEAEWKYLGDKIKLIDLRNNPVVCDCHIIWINCTLHVNTVMLGLCSNENYTETPLRRASIYMSQRCEKDGRIVNREKGKEINNCVGFVRERDRELPILRNDVRHESVDIPTNYPINGRKKKRN